MSSSTLRLVVEACQKAGRSLVHDFNEVESLQISRKGPADFVSIADQQAENILQEALLKIKADAGFIGEESPPIAPNSNEKWFVDPLDGTANFLHGTPHFAVSVALECDKKLQLGVIYQPTTGDIYWAEDGKGAFMNRKRIRVSKRDQLEYALLEADLTGKGRDLPILKNLPSFMPLRSQGSVALSMAYLASGKIDASWWCNVKPWDVAAGLIIIREAGGFSSDFNGKPFSLHNKELVTANPSIREQIFQLFRSK